jgi:mRNA interferase MazF
MQKGDIVIVASGPYSSKPRPVLIVQNDNLRTGNSIVVIPFTSFANQDIDLRIEVQKSKANGLQKTSYLEVDKISAIRQSAIAEICGKLSPQQMNKVTQAMSKLLL